MKGTSKSHDHAHRQRIDVRSCLANAQAQQVLLELQAAVLGTGGLADRQRAAVCTALAVANKDLVDGADEHLQLLHVAASTQRALCSL